MPKLIAASVAVAILAGIAALIAIIEEASSPEPSPTPGPAAVFTLVDESMETSRPASCHSRLTPPPPPIAGEEQTSVTSTVDRAIYECLFINTRSGILSPKQMPQDRVNENVANLIKAPQAKQCREEAALSPREALVSLSAAQQVTERVQLCYANLPAIQWEQATPEKRRETVEAVADLLTAYAYSYHRLEQEEALQCRIVYLEAAESRHLESAIDARAMLQTAEESRREYCGCVLQHLQVESNNPLRNRSC